MTAKDKAVELVSKMLFEIPCHCDDLQQAKQCALIAVNLLLSEFGVYEFYTEVKQEIELL